ncbi:hypothetical protein DPMN_176552 [Dreissena polymorpha]|uniref:Uncharacterized protein n=1 Tax=Dreissena polymorpha TaxID=45954 RepID=A0A9D4EB79_DREPO|nr:hypothetical protein DPMN_176552 [Dreissena polymorpha]
MRCYYLLVLQGVFNADRLPGKLALLTNGYKDDVQLQGNTGPNRNPRESRPTITSTPAQRALMSSDRTCMRPLKTAGFRSTGNRFLNHSRGSA